MTIITDNPLFQPLEKLYAQYNHRHFVNPDPLQFLYYFDHPLDQESVGLIASSLAYGQVGQIIKSTAKVLEILGFPESPIQSSKSLISSKSRISSKSQISSKPLLYTALENMAPAQLKALFANFKHRFTTGDEMAALIYGITQLQKKHESLENFFISLDSNPQEKTILSPMTLFCEGLNSFYSGKSSLIPREMRPLQNIEKCENAKNADHREKCRDNREKRPLLSSACKRMCLYFKWMIRRDQVDPGPWKNISPARLIMPIDTHIFRIGHRLNFTRRKNSDMKTALEITAGFVQVNPLDPLKYDFALTRPGIRRNIGDTISIDAFFENFAEVEI